MVVVPATPGLLHDLVVEVGEKVLVRVCPAHRVDDESELDLPAEKGEGGRGWGGGGEIGADAVRVGRDVGRGGGRRPDVLVQVDL